ncbi:hypothetical protein MMC26_004546 [Xylographa opegraphella]|nr:hypothetical protein [Xylographa opegraphella]
MLPGVPGKPLVAIVGATGTGKSQLAVFLAEKFNGEIINADALQLYKGLPIATNKIAVAERHDIPHHLLDCIGLYDEPWTAHRFVQEARTVVDKVRGKGKLPILVGGTHYYIQSLLFEDGVVDKSEAHISTEEQEQRWPILGKDGEEMLEELKKVDPAMARKWHPKDARKIRRSLQIWLETGKKASEIYAEQRPARKESDVVGAVGKSSEIAQFDSRTRPENLSNQHSSLCYDTLVFWLYRDPVALKESLDKRVDEMITRGLLAEVEYMDADYREQRRVGTLVDTTRGIWVAIGYKEFKDYIDAIRDGADALRVADHKRIGAELTKIATRQYAKRQDRWIRLKLVKALAEVQADGRLFLLDRGDEANSAETISYFVAIDFLAGKPLREPRSLSRTASAILDPAKVVAQDVKDDYVRHCNLCGTTVTTKRSWNDHTKSRKHKALLKAPRNFEYQDHEIAHAIHAGDE